MPISVAVSSWLGGDVIWGLLKINGIEYDVGPADLFWLAGYPILGAAMLHLVRRRGSERGRGALLHLVLSPGRTGLPGALLVAGTGLMLFLDTGMTLVARNWSELDVARLNGALLIANGLVVAPMLLRDRDLLLRPARAEVAALHPARPVFLGLALLTAPLLAVTRGSLPAQERVLLIIATVVTVALCLARFSGAVREQARTQQSLHHLAGHDSLTGLANRRAVNLLLARDFAGLVLLYIDLDGFKAVNDTHGHAAGDAVLVEVAERIRGQVRAEDLCARLGGDEFAILCRDLGPAGAAELADRLERALSEPIVADGTVVRVGASVGVSHADECADGEELLSRADHAMFATKRDRRVARPA